MIPEGDEVLLSPQGEPQENYERRAEKAIQSWNMGGGTSSVEPQSGSVLALSSYASSVDLRDFLSKRGKAESIKKSHCFFL